MVDMTGSTDPRGSLEFRKPWTLGVARTDIISLLTIVIIFTALTITAYALGYRVLMIPLVAFAIFMAYEMSSNIVETTRPRTVTLSRDRISMREGGKVRTIEFSSSVELEVGLREWVPDPEGPRGPAGPDQLEAIGPSILEDIYGIFIRDDPGSELIMVTTLEGWTKRDVAGLWEHLGPAVASHGLSLGHGLQNYVLTRSSAS